MAIVGGTCFISICLYSILRILFFFVFICMPLFMFYVSLFHSIPCIMGKKISNDLSLISVRRLSRLYFSYVFVCFFFFFFDFSFLFFLNVLFMYGFFFFLPCMLCRYVSRWERESGRFSDGDGNGDERR
ncbi:hypothetical protein GGR50DRAFT_95831 [Xylaria sp. CBS 124048]|nr:hypothetical protein GGR50DRAFT_95831 [Xylaria sp. CBS 124048]